MIKAMKKTRNYKALTKEENLLISNLEYFPEDANETVVHTMKNTEAKILAIAIYDCWRGSFMHAEIEKVNMCSTIYKKLFGKNVATLFNIPQPVLGEALIEKFGCNSIIIL
jgi:ferredoxin-fold anticodon binding domain-containing protein